MANNPKYFIVEASALPEVFLKVAEAKHLLATGQVATVNEAAKQTGIDQKQKSLLSALSPYVNSRRISKLERAMRAARMASMAGIFLNPSGR